MAETIATLAIEPDENGKFWISLDGAEDLGRKGPFETEEEAADAASALLEEIYINLANFALNGA